MPTGPVEPTDMSQFCFQKKYRTNECKQNKEFIYELHDVPEEFDKSNEANLKNGDEDGASNSEENLQVLPNLDPIDSEGVRI